jgi:hypothetical protein
MHGHRRPPLSTLVTAAAFGAVAGHAVTYMVAIPDPVTRQLFLVATGHGYLPAVVPAASILGIFAALSTVIRHLGGDRETCPPDRCTWGRTMGTLGLLQCGIFLTQETIERIAVGAPPETLVHDHVLPIGLLVQLGVAAVVSLVLFALGRTVEAVAAALSRRAPVPRWGRSFEPVPMSGLRSRLVAVAGSIRAPPAITSSSLV